MIQIPQKVDIEQATQACDVMIQLMHRRPDLTQAEVNAIGILCSFVHRVKPNIHWFENFIDILRSKELDRLKAINDFEAGC
jgi:hypothetical protein